jgi:DNA-binding HxlR family transcriptional regulator
MYERKIPIDFTCGIKLAMEAVGGKWKSCILIELRHGARRPSEIMKLFPDANQRVINLQLKELCDFGLIEKKIFAELPPHSEYSLTETGRSVLPLLDALDNWGDTLRPQMKKFFGEE